MHAVPAAAATGALALVVATGVALATDDAGGRPGSLPKEATIPLRLAVEAAAAAVEACEAQGFLVGAAVVDRGGSLKALLRADGAGPHATDSSFKKAYTSASLREPTGVLAQIIVDLPETQGLRDM
ncbi:MAG TPA: heme-binding protein, partial [Geminicoccaceae bacterium]|nr:heme-binding protein [Geminicoccaceae bacterium]